MRLLHTSDWHLGRFFHGAPLLSHQERALDRVVDLASEADVDAVVVAGDVYDRAIPPADAVDLLADVLGRLRATGARVVAITGNHDSPNRVGAFDALLRQSGVTLRGRFDPAVPVVMADRAGGPDLVVHPLPYLEPMVAAFDPSPTDPDGAGWAAVEELDPGPARPRRRTHQQVLARALGAARADLDRRGPVRSVVVAHAFVAGAAPSDSERELSVGGVDRVPISTFDGFSYAALGHLHRSQQLSDRVAYSGSLLPYSFSETGPVSVRVVDLAADGSIASEVVPLGVERRVVTLTGGLEALLSDRAHADDEGAWVRARLTNEVLPRHAMERLRQRFPHTVVLEHLAPAAARLTDDPRHRADEISDLDLTLGFMAERFGRAADQHEAALVRSAFDLVAAQRCELDPTDVRDHPDHAAAVAHAVEAADDGITPIAGAVA